MVRRDRAAVLSDLVAGLGGLPDSSSSMIGQCGRLSPSHASARWRSVLIICRRSVARILEFIDVGERQGLDVGAAALLMTAGRRWRGLCDAW